MSLPRNATITLVRRTKDWAGNILSPTTIGTYDVWNEERKTVDSISSRLSSIGGTIDEIEASKGLFFLFSDVDLTDTIAVINGSSYTVGSFDRFTNRKGDFHHMEVFYK